ncbi:MAG: exopolysaccharide biosynthesis protein, partial [Proteobacteria bacterium]
MSKTAEENGEMPPLFDVAALLATLWQRRLVVLATALTVVLLAFVYIAVSRPVYTASATILLDPRDSRATGLDTVLPGIGADSAAISSQVAVIQSVDLLSAVFDELRIAEDPEFAGGGLLSFGSKPSREAMFERFRDKLSVDREGLTYVIDVSFKSADREKAARIVNTIVERYKASLASEKDRANSEANALLNSRIGDLEKAVADAERAVQDFKFRNQIFDVGAGGTLQSRIDQFSQQLVAAQNASARAQTRYDQAIAAGGGADGLARLSEILNSATADKLRDDYNQRAAALANAEVKLGPRHPTIAALNAELARIRGLMAAEAARITAELKAQRDLAMKNVAQIQAQLAQLREEANRSDLAQVELRQLQRKADAARSVLDDFIKRSQETQHLEGMQISQVRVISDAVPPAQATWPKPKLLLPASAALGLM